MGRWLGYIAFSIIIFCGCALEIDDEFPSTIPPTTQPFSCATNFSVDSGNRSFSLVSQNCSVSLQYARVRLALYENGNRVWHDLAQWPVFQASETAITAKGHVSLPDLQIAVSFSDNKLILSPTLIANDKVQAAGLMIQGRLALPESPTNVAWLHNGYDSWTFTGVVELTPEDPPLPTNQGAIFPLGNNYDYWGDKKALSWWTTAVRGPSLRAGLVAGALSARKFKTYFATQPSPAHTDWTFTAITGTPGDSKALTPQQAYTLDPMYIAVSHDPVYGLIDYADEVAERTPPLQWNGYEPKGWASWYDYFGEVTQQNMLDNLAVQAHRYKNAGYNVCQLDDGYMNHWGDWQQTNDRFPDGLGFLANQIEAAGLVPGIWMAPTMVDPDSQIASDHPDWFLKDVDGEYFRTGDFFVKTKLILDITVPEARQWMSEQISQMVDLGYTYLKLDFLFSEAVEAPRYDQSMTTMEIYELLCDTIIEAAGDGVYLLASGQPFLPSAGKFHAARTSSDICGSPIDAPLWRMVHNNARYNAARFYAGGRFFGNDPDQLLVRAPLTFDEAEMAAAANVLLGSNLWLGDALVDLPADKEQLLTSDWLAKLESQSRPAIPLDLFERPCKRLVNFPYADIALGASRTAIAYLSGDRLFLMNWFNSYADIALTPTQLGFKANDKVVAQEVDGDLFVSTIQGELEFSIEPKQMRVFMLSKTE